MKMKIDKNRTLEKLTISSFVMNLLVFSGDHHIHAAGCAHYTKPSEGVHAPDMMLHIVGEDLKVGCNLTWGPCFDYQKQVIICVKS